MPCSSAQKAKMLCELESRSEFKMAEPSDVERECVSSVCAEHFMRQHAREV